jgi:anthranilate phosphoribosyltransferase
MTSVITQALDAVASGRDLTTEQASEVLAVIMSGDAEEAQIAGLLIGLRTKGETQEEIAGLARTMRDKAVPVSTARADLLDTAGTGGGRPSFNVSTTAALIAAGAGCAMAKHGNRSATGLSGSADVLEALGVRIDLTPEQVGRCLDEVGFGFMFAPTHHGATRYVIPVRRSLAVRTIFNFLGPLTNPAGARRQLIGVSDANYLETMAGALAQLGAERALVVSSADGLDELSIAAPTRVVEVNGTEITSYTVSPEDVGLPTTPDPQATAGGEPALNAEITRAILAGEEGPRSDLAVLNAGAAIYAGGGAETLAAGVEAAREAIADGSAAATLERLVAVTGRLASATGARL